MGAEPGTVLWLDWRDTTGISASTHTLPPYMLAQFMAAEFGCDVALLGIQPLSNQFDTPVSPLVQSAIDAVIRELVAALVDAPNTPTEPNSAG